MFWGSGDTGSGDNAEGSTSIDVTELEWTLRSHVDHSIQALRQELQDAIKDIRVEQGVRMEELQQHLERRWSNVFFSGEHRQHHHHHHKESRSRLSSVADDASAARSSIRENPDFAWVLSTVSSDNTKVDYKGENIDAAWLQELINKTNQTAELGVKGSEEALERLGAVMDDVDGVRTQFTAVDARLARIEEVSVHHPQFTAQFSVHSKRFGHSPTGSPGTISDVWGKMPNAYRTPNKTGDGYDVSFHRQEKVVTAAVMFVTLVLAIFLAQQYWPMRFFHQNNLLEPTLEQYVAIYKDHAETLIGDPQCSCAHHTIIHDSHRGGFVNMQFISAPLDSWCDLLLDESQTIATTVGEMFADLVPAPVPGAPADASGAIPWLWACPGLDAINGPGPNLDWNASLVGWADCAVIQVLSRQVALSARQLCTSAEHVHSHSLRNYGDSYHLSLLMESEAFMARHLEVSLYEMARLNLEIYTGSYSLQNEEARYLDSELVDLHYFNEFTGNENLRFVCPFFELGPAGDGPAPLTRVMLQCNSTGTWTGRCCMSTNGTNCDDWLTMPCNEEMRLLGAGAAASVFPSFTTSYEHAFLEGLTPANNMAREQRMALNEEEYFAEYGHGATLNVGFVWTFHLGTVFKAYYEACLPTICQFWTKMEHLEGLVLIVMGLLGGMAAGARNAGNVILLALRTCFGKKERTLKRNGKSGDKLGVSSTSVDELASPKVPSTQVSFGEASPRSDKPPSASASFSTPRQE